MKKNKDIKKGDPIWINCAYLRRESSYPVISVKKTGTLVEVVVNGHPSISGKANEIKMYGHASSCILSGFDRCCPDYEMHYTCDYDTIFEMMKKCERDEKFKSAGRALLNLVKYLK